MSKIQVVLNLEWSDLAELSSWRPVPYEVPPLPDGVVAEVNRVVSELQRDTDHCQTCRHRGARYFSSKELTCPGGWRETRGGEAIDCDPATKAWRDDWFVTSDEVVDPAAPACPGWED